MYTNMNYVPLVHAVPWDGMRTQEGAKSWSQDSMQTFVPWQMPTTYVPRPLAACAGRVGGLALGSAPWGLVPQAMPMGQQLPLQQDVTFDVSQQGLRDLPLQLDDEHEHFSEQDDESPVGAPGQRRRRPRARRKGAKAAAAAWAYARAEADEAAVAATAEVAERPPARPDAAEDDAFPPLSSTLDPVKRGTGGCDGPGAEVFPCPLPNHPGRRAGDLAEDAELCNELASALDGGSCDSGEALRWILPELLPLSLAPLSCRVIQKLLEYTGGHDRDLLADALIPHMVTLYESRHGNYVITKVIEVMPSTALRPIIDRIRAKHTVVARHRFGCRLLERLIEHATEEDMGELVDQYVAEAEDLCRHQFANFVIQHLLEHGSEDRKARILRRMLPTVRHLSQHRTASHVVQRALANCSPQDKCELVQAIVGSRPRAVAELAATRYGSFVVEELLSIPFAAEHVIRCLREAPESLKQLPAFVRIAAACGLGPPAPARADVPAPAPAIAEPAGERADAPVRSSAVSWGATEVYVIGDR